MNQLATEHPMRAWRKEHDKTLAELAAVAGVTPTHLSEIERGVNNCSPKLARKLSNETGIPFEQFFPQSEAAE